MENNSKYFFYTIIEPLQESYSDFGENDIFSYDVELSIGTCQIALVGINNIPQLIRIRFDLEKDVDTVISSGLRAEFDRINHEAILVLRIICDPNMKLANIGPAAHFGFASENGKPQNGPIQFKAAANLNLETFMAVKSSNGNNIDFVGLYMESWSNNIPENYKFLSLYRILEMLFKNASNGKWDDNFEVFLKVYENKFNEKYCEPGIKKSLKNYVETMRNQCTHGKFIYKSVITTGITGGDVKGNVVIRQFLPFFREIVKQSILNRYSKIYIP